MRKIAIGISKGGQAKTTTAVTMAHGLSLGGARVLLCDLDTQGQCAHCLGVDAPKGLAEFIDGDAEGLVKDVRPGLDLLAGGDKLAGAKRDIGRRDFGSEQVLSEALAGIDGDYDYVLLDLPPSHDVLNINAYFYADEILAPISLEPLAAMGLRSFSRTVEEVRQYRPELTLRYILPTFLDTRLAQTDEILAQLRAAFPEMVLDPIRINVRLSEAPGHGQTIFEYDPQSNGAIDYLKLVKRIKADG